MIWFARGTLDKHVGHTQFVLSKGLRLSALPLSKHGHCLDMVDGPRAKHEQLQASILRSDAHVVLRSALKQRSLYIQTEWVLANQNAARANQEDDEVGLVRPPCDGGVFWV